MIMRLMIWAIAGILLLSGCETPTKPDPKPPEQFLKEDLSFIKDGVITREEVLMRFGMPSAMFENERILLYPFMLGGDGNWSIGGAQFMPRSPLRAWHPTTCNLVLVFSEDGILEQHKLVLPNAFIKKPPEAPDAPQTP